MNETETETPTEYATPTETWLRNRAAAPNPYTANGYKNRADYLSCLCEEYPADLVHALSDILGPSEDFDGLVSGLDDAMDSGEFYE